MSQELFDVSVPSRRQVMEEEGYNGNLEKILEYTASDETIDTIYKMFTSPSIHDEQRSRFIMLYNEKGNELLKDLSKSPVRFYAMYLENPQWFAHKPDTVVACGLKASMNELMKGSKGIKYKRFPIKALKFFTEIAIDTMYYDAKFLKEGKQYAAKYL